MTNIHKTAIVHAGAKISPTATIGAYTTIGKDVVIKAGTMVAQFCVIDGDTTIGQNNQIDPSCLDKTYFPVLSFLYC